MLKILIFNQILLDGGYTGIQQLFCCLHRFKLNFWEKIKKDLDAYDKIIYTFYSFQRFYDADTEIHTFLRKT